MRIVISPLRDSSSPPERELIQVAVKNRRLGILFAVMNDLAWQIDILSDGKLGRAAVFISQAAPLVLILRDRPHANKYHYRLKPASTSPHQTMNPWSLDLIHAQNVARSEVTAAYFCKTASK
jgi:hypothetical protein